MHEKGFSIIENHKNKSAIEKAAQVIFTGCAFFAVLAVFSITAYMIISGTPALFKVGILDILFGRCGNRRRIRRPLESCSSF